MLNTSATNVYHYAYYFDVYLHTVETDQRYYASLYKEETSTLYNFTANTLATFVAEVCQRLLNGRYFIAVRIPRNLTKITWLVKTLTK